jgi:hypothetical protein
MLGLLGSILVFVGAIWLIITAIQTGKDTADKVIWALVNFLCQPLGGIIFFIVKKQGLVPLLLVLAGMVCMFFGGAMNFTSSFGTP